PPFLPARGRRSEVDRHAYARAPCLRSHSWRRRGPFKSSDGISRRQLLVQSVGTEVASRGGSIDGACRGFGQLRAFLTGLPRSSLNGSRTKATFSSEGATGGSCPHLEFRALLDR